MENRRFFAGLLFVLTVLSYAALAAGQTSAPLLINYQGELKSPATGKPVPDGNYDMAFEIFTAETRGVSVWRGSYTAANSNPVEVKDGLFSVILGSGTGNKMDASVFKENERWLEISIEREMLLPRQRITSAAYSLVSENSRLLGGNEPSQFIIQAQGLRLETNAESPNIIAGHEDNAVTTGVVAATIGGGGTSGGANVVTDDYGTIGGGVGHQAGDNAGTTEDAWYATVGGGYWNTASATVATVGGGSSNEAIARSSTVCGGESNTASGYYSTVGGGLRNTTSGRHATVGGGSRNLASADYATISGGGPSDLADGENTNNRVFDDYGTIGGGGCNRAGSDDADPATDKYATVGGGFSNAASGHHATVGGGYGNTASDSYASVAGGNSNIASGLSATVGGGASNTASDRYATVCGGIHNTAGGQSSFAGGCWAQANHDGAFVWGDNQAAVIASTTEDQVTFRCQGGVWFLSGNTWSNQEVSWAPGDSSWTFSSDMNLKENLVEIDARDVLEKVSALAITEWNFKNHSERHIGPVAQDFHALFPLGGSDTTIDSGDLQGVSLAAIQGLHEIVKEKDAKISSLESRIETLETLVEKLAESQAGGE